MRRRIGLGLIMLVVVLGAWSIGGNQLALPSIVGLIAGWLSARMSKLIVAEEFRLVDSSGTRRASLGPQFERVANQRVSVDGSPALELFHRDGQKGCTLSLFPDGTAMVALWGKDGASRVALVLSPDQAAGLFVGHQSSKPGVTIRVRPGERPQIQSVDSDGTVVWAAP